MGRHAADCLLFLCGCADTRAGVSGGGPSKWGGRAVQEVDNGSPGDRLPIRQQQCGDRLRIVIVAVRQEWDQLSLRQRGLTEKFSKPQDSYAGQCKVEQQFGTVGCDVPLGGNEDPLAILRIAATAKDERSR